MMETLNISLPKKLSVKIDEIVEEEGYVSRSEFFRTLLRLYLQLVKPGSKTASFFIPFKKRPLSQIERELKKTGLYEKKFIDSVIVGLAKSSLYAHRAPKK